MTEYINIAKYLLVKKCLKSDNCTVYTTLNPAVRRLVYKIVIYDEFPESMKYKPTRVEYFKNRIFLILAIKLNKVPKIIK